MAELEHCHLSAMQCHRPLRDIFQLSIPSLIPGHLLQAEELALSDENRRAIPIPYLMQPAGGRRAVPAPYMDKSLDLAMNVKVAGEPTTKVLV